MKRAHFIMLCLGLLAYGATYSQTSEQRRLSMSTYQAKADRETSFMKDSLGLSTPQAAQVGALNNKHLRDIALLEGQSISEAERRQKIVEYKLKREQELSGILTPQQFQRYKALVKAQEDRAKARLQTN